MTVGAQILEVIFKNPGITAPEITAFFDKNPRHIYNELNALESTRKVTVDRSYRPQRYYPIGVCADNIVTEERRDVSENIKEYVVIIKRDKDANVWIAENSDIPIVLEDDSLEMLMERVKQAVPEMTELNGLVRPKGLVFVIQAIIKTTITS